MCRACNNLPDWPALATLIRVESRRITRTTDNTETRYYISDLTDIAEQFAQRIRGY